MGIPVRDGNGPPRGILWNPIWGNPIWVRCKTGPVPGFSWRRPVKSYTHAALLLALVLSGVVHAAGSCREPPETAPWPKLVLEEVASGFRKPLLLTHAGDGSGRLYVVEQGGRIWVLEDGRPRRLFLDIRDRVRSGGEKGLLGLAFHPRFSDNGFFFVNYTTRRGGTLWTVVSRFHAPSPTAAAPGSEREVLRVRQPFGNHNGGHLAFGPDGMLYIGLGDGGAANDPLKHGQNLASWLGALLRIDVNVSEEGPPYRVPADNPYRDVFQNVPRARPEIWAYGLRNPWRFSFDRGTGLLYLADVGQDRMEEINIVVRGGNYGWDLMEGELCMRGVSPCPPPGVELPIFTYAHPRGFAVTGGYVYRGSEIPVLCGIYVYGDYVAGTVWGLRYNGQRVVRQGTLLATPYRISSFGEDEAGELYLLAHQRGAVLKFREVEMR